MKTPLALCCLALAAACATPRSRPAPAAAGPTAADFYPLIPGTRWVYDARQLGESRTLEVSMVRAVDDGFTEDSTGAQLKVDAFGVRDQRRYLLRNPVEPGTTWTNVVSVQTVEAYEIVATRQPCEAPAGRWDGCVIVEGRTRVKEGTTLVNEMTFAPGVGLVRVSTVIESGGRQIPQASLALRQFVAAPRPAAP